MATIRASCPDCGTAELSPNEVTTRFCIDNGHQAFLFRCPSCSMMVVKDVDERIVRHLVLAGVEQLIWRLPLEIQERPIGGPAFTDDDVVAFHELLGDDDWYTRAGLT
jgi:hypothetical protein